MRLERNPEHKDGYEDRHEYWKATLADSDLKTLLVETSYSHAQKFFETVNSKVIPPLRAGQSRRLKTPVATRCAQTPLA